MDVQTWLQAQLNWQYEPGLWLAGPVILYALAGTIAWVVQRRPAVLGALAPRIRAWPGSYWLLQLVCWAFLFGLPYAALTMGIVSPRWMGLSEIDWVQSMGVGGPLAAAALALLWLSWWCYRRGLPALEGDTAPDSPYPALRWLRAIVETAALQAHWAFYRGVFVGGGWVADPQWGSWAGLAMSCMGWALSPWLWQALRQPARSDRVLRHAVLAVVTTALFILTRNFWLCWALHALFEMVATHVGN